MNIRRVLLCLTIALCTRAPAQNTSELTGYVYARDGDVPIEFATIRLLNATDSNLLAGTVTDKNGYWKLPARERNSYLEISFLGMRGVRIDGPQADTTYRTELTDDEQTLESITVKGKRSQTTFQLDRRIFHVGEDLSGGGGSALDVLNHVPSVTVSIEGSIALRGSEGVLILVDGKPSVLAAEGGNALGTLTANMIERIEVITNPAANYDAAGTAGIINIVLRREDKRGTNGSVTLNGGLPHNHSLGLSINRRSERLNLFAQAGGGYRRFPSELRNRQRLGGGEIETSGDTEKNETFLNLILGADYHLDDRNLLSFSSQLAYEWEDEFSRQYFLRRAAGRTTPTSRWARSEITEAINPKWRYDLSYRRRFAPPADEKRKHELSVSMLGNSFAKDRSSIFANEVLTGPPPRADQRTRSDFAETEYTFSVDYHRPLGKLIQLETGGRYVYVDSYNDFGIAERTGADFREVPELTGDFQFRRGVAAAYGTAAYLGERWSVKAGLRLEHTERKTWLIGTGKRAFSSFLDLFPTVHTNYELSEAGSLQGSYSRRVYRPGMWRLNPFVDVRDNFNLSTGNPNLRPEYTDSYELTGIWIFEDISLNLGSYYSTTRQVIQEAVFTEGLVTVSRPVNLGTTAAAGLEMNGKYSGNEWLSLAADLNFSYLDQEAELEGNNFDYRATRLTGRVVADASLRRGWEAELSGHYRSATRDLQGRESGTAWFDLGLRKKLAGGRWIVNASIRDVLASRRSERSLVLEEGTIYTWRRRGRFITLGVSYGFGEGEAMEFGGRKRF